MRGRKPTPTALKIVRGVSKRKLNRSEPRVVVGDPVMPEHLLPAAAAEWERIVPLLRHMGVLTEVDGALLADYCQVSARLVEAEALITKYGAVFERPVMNRNREQIGTELKKNPAVTVADALMKQKRAILSAFGAEPSARSRIKGAVAEPEDSALVRLLKQQQEHRSRQRSEYEMTSRTA